MAEQAIAVRGMINLLEQNSLSLGVWSIYLEKIQDADLKELAARLRSSLEYASQTKQLKGIAKANYLSGINTWNMLQGKSDDIRLLGKELLAACERYLKKQGITLV